MGTDVDRQLKVPEGLDGGRAATAVQLDGLLAHVVYNLVAQLRRETHHGTGKSLTV